MAEEDDEVPLLEDNDDDDDGDDGDDGDDDDSVSEELVHLQEQDMDDSDDVTPPENITFDVNLPGEHTYLGTDFEELQGRTMLEEDVYTNLPILTLPGVVLVPGQTLPLHLFQSQTISMIKHVCDKDKTFGIVTARYLTNGPSLACVGTTAEVHSIKEETDDLVGLLTMRVKAVGRQRFEVLETRRQVTGIVVAKVRILPEKTLPYNLEGACLKSHLRHHIPSLSSASAAGDMMKRRRRKIMLEKYSCANWTWWPPWVYKLYDQELLVQQVKEELKGWNLSVNIDKLPQEPIEFSYWVAGNLPLDDTMKLHLLQLDSAVQRLRCELGILKKCSVLCCRECGSNITHKKDVFSLALTGAMAAYVNPGGHVHETLTVYKAQGMTLIGRPSTDHSWFPGYAWTIANCRNCGTHKGWRFSATEKHLQPVNFWGITRSGLQPGFDEEDQEMQWEPII